MRKKRRFKYTSQERLFHFLMMLKEYPTITAAGKDSHLCRSAVYADFVWLRLKLSQHPVLVAEVQWGTPQELEEQRKKVDEEVDDDVDT